MTTPCFVHKGAEAPGREVTDPRAHGGVGAYPLPTPTLTPLKVTGLCRMFRSQYKQVRG